MFQVRQQLQKQIAVQLIQAAIELIEPSIKEGHIDEQIAKKFTRVYEAVISAYLGSIIESLNYTYNFCSN